MWHSVCDDTWSEREAAVVCHTLGYSNESNSIILICLSAVMIYIMMMFFSASFLASFGRDASPMLQCNGDEMTISDCMLVTNGNLLDCKQTAGVICEGLIY